MYKIKKQKDKDIALKLVIQNLKQFQLEISARIEILESYIGKKRHHIGTYKGSNKAYIMSDPQ